MSVPFFNGRCIPVELLENIAFMLVVSFPLGNPGALIPLLQTSKAVHSALCLKSRTSLYSRICRFKFDTGAVTRRAFVPHGRDLKDHLVQMCELLAFVRRGDVFHEDAEDYLVIAFIAMLNDDGKNRAQLEAAGIEDFVEAMVRLRLHEGKESNDMWPIENTKNSCALWLLWFFTTRAKLEQETISQREALIELIFPFVICPYRYASAVAPPNHFVLPLGESNPVQQDLFTVRAAHGPYPVYYTNRHSVSVLHYFRSNTTFLVPPITAAAKLLYWSRREITPFFRPGPGIPRNRQEAGGNIVPTQEDLDDFNQFKAARLPLVVRWDWDRGAAVLHTEDGTQNAWKGAASARWDTDWWRMRMCHSVFWKQPKWRLGQVYERGMITGLWQGVYFFANNTTLDQISSIAQLPNDMAELSMAFMMRPIMMRLREHAFIRTPALTSLPPSSHFVEGNDCRTVAAPHPIPPARSRSVRALLRTEEGNREAVLPVDVGFSNAWFPGPTGSVRWVDGDPLDACVEEDRLNVNSSLDSNRKHRSGIKDPEPMPSITFFVSSENSMPNRNREFSDVRTGPIEANVPSPPGSHYLYETYTKAGQSVHERLLDAKKDLKYSSIPLSSPSPSTSAAPPFLRHPGCTRCADREEVLTARRKQDRSRASHFGVNLDSEVEDLFSSVGMGKTSFGSYLPFADEDGQEDETQVLDLDLGGDEEGFSDDSQDGAPSPSNGSEDDDSEANGFDEDLERGHPGICDSFGRVRYEPLRRSHDRYRVEKCDDGVEDTVITGELDERHRLAWGHSIYYGRVRPWDGLIAILKQEFNEEGNIANFLFYGYIYGGNNFVGNWRYAAVDPLTPGFESCFIMSKRS